MSTVSVSPISNSLLSAHALTRRFGGLIAIDRVSVDLRVGEVHAVIGTNGAGKSTLINLLSGELAATSGSIAYDGRDITHRSQPHRAQAGIGRTYQRTTIFAPLTVFENIRLAAQAHRQRPWAWHESAQACRASVDAAREALQASGLESDATQVAQQLSHGRKRQLEIAMCLATHPRVLLLDEPLAGMGAEETDRMLALLERLKPSHAILLVEHDMDAVFRIADRITVMVNGSTLASDTPQRIRANVDVQTAYLGEAH